MLTVAKIKAAKPRQKPYKLADGGGLYLEVSPSGGRWWRFKYRLDGREKRLSLGTFPEVSLAEARERLADARKLVQAGRDPSVERQAEKAARRDAAANTFQAIAGEWLATRTNWAESHREKVLGRFRNFIFPKLGKRGIATITGREVADLARQIGEESPDTARRVLQQMGSVFRYAMRRHLAEHDPTYRIHEVVPQSPKAHFAAITDPVEVGGLLRAIDGYTGAFVTRCALRLAPLVFVRPGELRLAEWREFDLDAAEWLIPAARMKGRRDHLVPLSRQAVAILRELHGLTGRGRFVFPGVRSSQRGLSENTLTAALRNLGYERDRMTVHGFRSVASTLLHELGYPSHVIETQLAHKDRDTVRAAYNRAAYLPERKRMMQAWADYLDSLKAGAKVVALRGKARA